MQAGPLEHFHRIHDLFARLQAPSSLIGGWAAVAWGVVRATKDVDLLADLSNPGKATVLAALRKAGYSPDWRTGGEDDPIPELLHIGRKGSDLAVDVIVAHKAFDFAALRRCRKVRIGSWHAPVLAPEDLVAMKLFAGGALDFEDARGILQTQTGKIDQDTLLQACQSLRVTKALALLRKSL